MTKRDFWVGVFFAMLGLVAALWFPDGRIDYCWVEHAPARADHLDTYVVWGHRPWSANVVVAVAPTAEQAEGARRAMCP